MATTVQQRIREVLGENYTCDSRYISGRGGESLVYVTPNFPGLDLIKDMSVFETWKMVRSDGKSEPYVTHIFVVRSKKGIVRGMAALDQNSSYFSINVHAFSEAKVQEMHEYNRTYPSYSKDLKVISYEKVQ